MYRTRIRVYQQFLNSLFTLSEIIFFYWYGKTYLSTCIVFRKTLYSANIDYNSIQTMFMLSFWEGSALPPNLELEPRSSTSPRVTVDGIRVWEIPQILSLVTPPDAPEAFTTQTNNTEGIHVLSSWLLFTLVELPLGQVKKRKSRSEWKAGR